MHVDHQPDNEVRIIICVFSTAHKNFPFSISLVQSAHAWFREPSK